MADRPIIFSAPMIRALLDGRKTQTRRILRLPRWASKDPNDVEFGESGAAEVICEDTGCLAALPLPYAIGDRLWVRENCRAVEQPSGDDGVEFAADLAWEAIQPTRESADAWLDLYHYGRRRGAAVPSIHMPRWASRLTLLVTDARVQRLQDISEADAAEGAEGMPTWGSHRNGFNAIWLDIHGVESWNANPLVAAISFTVSRRNIDFVPADALDIAGAA